MECQRCTNRSEGVTYTRVVVRAGEVRGGAPCVVGGVELLGNVLIIRVRAREVYQGEVALGTVLEVLSVNHAA